MGHAGRSALTFRGWAEQKPEHGHEDTWVLSMGLGKVIQFILGKPCSAGEVRVKGVEQRQHLPWTHASLENMEVFWGRWDSFHCCLKKKKKVSSLSGKYSLVSLLPVQLSREKEPSSWWATLFHVQAVCVKAFAAALLLYFLAWIAFQLSC